MLSFRNSTIVFLVLLAGFSLLSLYHFTGYLLLFALAVTYTLMLVFGSIFVCSGFYVRAFCSKRTDEKVIALTFDDGPDPVITPQVLDLLARHQVPAMFFVIGRNVTDNQHIMERMMKEGHAVGNHSWSHSSCFDLWRSRQMMADVSRADDIIALATGQRPVWFRPPFGVTNPTVAITVNRKGYSVMGWSIRSFDTTIKESVRIFERISKRWHPGGIILLHDTSDRVIEVLELIIEHAGKEGYRFVRADQMEF